MAGPSDNNIHSSQFHASNGPDTADMNEDDCCCEPWCLLVDSELDLWGSNILLDAGMSK